MRSKTEAGCPLRRCARLFCFKVQYMKINRWRGALGIALPLFLGMAWSGAAAAATQAAAQPQRGGSLNVAYPANPATLDPHLTTNQATRDVSRNIYEQLLTLNGKYEVVPQLAESYG